MHILTDSNDTNDSCRQMSVELQKTVPLMSPICDVRMCGNEDFDWTPYPRSNKITYDKKPARLPEVREAWAEITILLVDVQKLISDKRRGTRIDEIWKNAKEPFDRLTAWLQRWPSVDEIQQDPVPQVLLLR